MGLPRTLPRRIDAAEAVHREQRARLCSPVPNARDTCERFRLRHAFAVEQEEDLPYYLSVQLQYGFSLPHARNQLGNWLRGHRPPEVALRLLEPAGYYRSTSFRRLVRT